MVLLKKLLELLRNFFKNHKIGTIIVSVLAALGLGGEGIRRSRKAKKLNQNAMDIRNEAINSHDVSRKKIEKALEKLGTAEISVTDGFYVFSDAIEKIKGRPSFKNKLFNKIKLPEIEIHDFKILSNDLRMAVDAVGGATIGVAAGLATVGVSAFIAAPGALGTGIILCIKGIGLEKKAANNLKEANNLKKQVNEILIYYEDLANAADSLRRTIESVYQQYLIHLNGLLILVERNQEWKTYSKAEKITVENTVRLAKLLYEICKTDLVVKPENKNELEKVNDKEIIRLSSLADSLLLDIQK